MAEDPSPADLCQARRVPDPLDLLARAYGDLSAVLTALTVEAAVHPLDLVRRLDRPGPAAAPLAEVRRVLAGLLGGPCRRAGTTSPPPGAAPDASR